jgi:predicted molibdopterin-dependent oxidoreductase YjgC
MTNSIADLSQADVVLVIGSNTTEAHPIIGIELKRAAKQGTKIYVVDPRRIRLIEHAVKWLPIDPGANVALVNAMMRIILDAGLADEEFIGTRTEGFEELKTLLDGYDLQTAAERCGVPLDDIRELALAYGGAERASIVYAMGVTQHSSGTEQVRSLANLAMLTGNIGRPGTGVNPLRGQNNVQGACDLACLPNCLPGYQPLTDDSVAKTCELWEIEPTLPASPGLTLVEMMDAAVAGEVRAMYIMGENPVVADPDQAHVIEALESLDFLVVQDIFLTETAAMADVVLPAASFLEKDGTFTNTDRTIKRVRPVISVPEGAKTDLEIVTSLAALLGVDMQYGSSSDVMDEMAEVTPQYGGVNYGRIEAEGGIQWPCPDDGHPGTAVLHSQAFTRGRGQFAPVDWKPPVERATADRPLVLTTGRHLHNFHTDTMVRRAAGLSELNPTGYVEIHASDAQNLDISDGDRVVVESAHGSVETTAYVCAKGGPKPGVVFMPFHFADAPANRVTNSNLDPSAKIPALKVTAVSVRKA